MKTCLLMVMMLGAPAWAATDNDDDELVKRKPPAQVMMLPAEAAGWRLVQQPDGSIWRERRTRSYSKVAFGITLAVLSGTWIAGGIASLHDADQYAGLGFFPVVGPLVDAEIADRHHQDAARMLWTFTALTEACALGGMIASLGLGPVRIEREPVVLAPLVSGTSAGVSASGRF